MVKIKIKKIIPVAYSSSLIQQNFGENINNHGFLLWNVLEKTYEEHNVANNYPFYQIRITSLEDLENNNEKIFNLG